VGQPLGQSPEGGAGAGSSITALLTALFDWQSSKEGGAGGDGAADAWRLFDGNFKVRSRARANVCVCILPQYPPSLLLL
jgi:hypothetical protein